MKTDDELKQIAIDIAEGDIYSSLHMMMSDGNMDEMPLVFMPIAMGSLAKMTEQEKKDMGVIYEYMSEATPQTVNGKPIFTSMRYLSWEETKKLYKFHGEYVKSKLE